MLKIRIAIPFAGLALTACGQSEAGRPNVIYVFPDQYRNSSLGFWSDPEFAAEVGWKGDPVATPNLDRFAREATVLTEAVSNFPVSSPHRGMLLSGMYPERNGVVLNCMSERPESSLREDAECIGDVFSAAGYDCAYIGKLHADFPTKNNPQRPGTYVSDAVPEWDAYTPPERRHGFNYWYSYGTYDVHKHPHYWDTDGNRHDVDEWSPRHEVSKAIEYIENKGGVRDPEKPFLMMIGMNPPHSPYASTDDCDLEGYERYKDKSLTELLVRDNADTTMAKAAAVRYYFANVSGIDREFGRRFGPRRDDDQPFDRRPQELDLARVAEHSLSGALSGAGAAPCGRSAALDARHHADAAGAGGPRGAGSRECRGARLLGRAAAGRRAARTPARCPLHAQPRRRARCRRTGPRLLRPGARREDRNAYDGAAHRPI